MIFDPQDLAVVLQVVARDDDQGANGQLSYMLSGGNDEGAFSLSSSGQLSLTQTLDREAQGKYILLITATDSGETAAPGSEPLIAILKCLKDDFMAVLRDYVSLHGAPKSLVYPSIQIRLVKLCFSTIRGEFVLTRTLLDFCKSYSDT